MAGIGDQELLAEIAQMRQQRRSAGVVAVPPGIEAELQSIRRERAAKQESKFLAENAPFREAEDNLQEVGAGTRAVASLPITEQGKIDYLTKRFGPDNVKAGNGKIIVRDNGKWTNLNNEGLSWGDVAAMAGPAIEVVPQVVAGAVASGAGPAVAIPAAGIAGAAGNVLRQGVAKLATGETIPSPERSSDPELDLLRGGAMSERVKQPLVAGALSAVGEGVIRAGAAGLRAMTPTAKLERAVAKSDPQAIKEGLSLREQTGSSMSLGDITQSDEIMRIEALQRQTPGPAGIVAAMDTAKTKGLNAYARKIADQVAGGEAPRAADAGAALAEIRGQLRKTYMDKLRGQALADYQRVEDLSPGSSYLTTANTQANIDKMIAGKSTRFNTTAGKATLAKLEEAKRDLMGWLSKEEAAKIPDPWSDNSWLTEPDTITKLRSSAVNSVSEFQGNPNQGAANTDKTNVIKLKKKYSRDAEAFSGGGMEPGSPDPDLADIAANPELASPPLGALSPAEFQRSMEVWRKVAGTGQGVDLGLSRDETKEMGKTIMAGLYADLDAAAASTEGAANNPAAQALKTARDNYRAGKLAVEANDSDILKRAAIMVDKAQNAGRVVTDIAAGRADSAQLKKTLAVLDANKPEAANELRGSVVRTIFAPKKGEIDSPAVMLSKLGTEKNREVMGALFASDQTTQNKLSMLNKLASRLAANQRMLAGSPTAPRQVAQGVLNELPWIGPALKAVGHPIETLSTLSDRMTSSAAMAKLTSTREGIDVLLGLMKPRTNVSREVAKDIARLAARAIELTAEETPAEPQP